MTLSYQRIAKGTPEYHLTRNLYNTEFPDTTADVEFDRIIDILEKISADIYTYSYDGTYAGFTISITGKLHVYYYMIAVNPELRSKGIGSQIASIVRNMHPEKALTGIVEADDFSPEGQKILKQRLAFHARSGLKKTGYHMYFNAHDFFILSTDESFNPSDLTDIAKLLKPALGEITKDAKIVWVGD